MLERGRRVREVFKQPQFEPLPVPDQVAVLLAAGEGVLNAVPLDKVAEVERAVRKAVAAELPAVCERMAAGSKLTPEDRGELLRVIRVAVAAFGGGDGGTHA
jgi:F-type H+-transporting ATPase subunit alpha